MAKILIVDDERKNRELIHAYLEGAEHELSEAASGEQALAAARVTPPDLVLLDVLMPPGISGFETALRLKQQAGDEFLPIIFLTGLADRESRFGGLSTGADDYLTKPVDLEQLGVRVANLLALREKERTLARRNVELVELQRFSEEMSALIVHDLKNPLAVVLANLEYVQERVSDEDDRQAIIESREAGQRALRLLLNLLQLTKIESKRLQLSRTTTRLATIVDPLLAQRSRLVQARGIRLERAGDLDARLTVDVDLMTRVLENVFDNAIRYTPRGGVIQVESQPADALVHLCIGNSGPPVPPEARARIFEKFGQATPGVGRTNLGLGLYFCRLATEAHGGRMWVEERAALPTVFCLELPS